MMVRCCNCRRCIRNNFDDSKFDCTDRFYPRKDMNYKQIRAYRICHGHERREKEIVK